MPRLAQDDSDKMMKVNAGHFGFSAVKLDQLNASQYTLVTVCLDASGSVRCFARQIEEVMKQVVDACQKSPRSDNLMLRVITFNDQHAEFHGFKLFNDVKKDDYENALNPSGSTAAYDAIVDGVEAMVNYSTKMHEEKYSQNGILFVITDGDDNMSTLKIEHVKKALQEALNSETLESLVSVLVAVNSKSFKQKLDDFHKEAGFTHFVDVGDLLDASNKPLPNAARKLAKFAEFVSQSISSQSQVIGSGGPSQQIVNPTF